MNSFHFLFSLSMKALKCKVWFFPHVSLKGMKLICVLFGFSLQTTTSLLGLWLSLSAKEKILPHPKRCSQQRGLQASCLLLRTLLSSSGGWLCAPVGTVKGLLLMSSCWAMLPSALSHEHEMSDTAQDARDYSAWEWQSQPAFSCNYLRYYRDFIFWK